MACFEDTAAGAEKLRLWRLSEGRCGAVPDVVRSEAEPVPFEAGEPLIRECRHFLDCIDGRAAPLTDVAESIRVLTVLSSARASTPGVASI